MAPKYDSFKQVLFSHLSHPVFAGSTSVCIKQCWYLCKASDNQLLYDNHIQITKLSAEMNCMWWANGDCLWFCWEKHCKMWWTPFCNPKHALYEDALIIANSIYDAYMVEEVIDEVSDGMFVKYIGNGSMQPFDFLSGEAANCAQFLTFAHHVQYMKTKNLYSLGIFKVNFLWNANWCALTRPFQVELIYWQIPKSSLHCVFLN